MKNVLGIDLGVGSIGWCLLEKDEHNAPTEIKGIGSRIVPLTTDEEKQFSKGNAISKNAERTAKRTARKGQDRYQLRRYTLSVMLREMGMFPEERLFSLNPLELWSLRAKAATPDNPLSLQELGRVLYHLNQKRGYKHSRTSSDSKESDYVNAVNKRYAELKESTLTLGQYFAEKLKDSEYTYPNGKKHYSFRIKDLVFPRAAYEEEFWAIMRAQQSHYPNLLTDERIEDLFGIIYLQRPLKSCKHLVSVCEFEKKVYRDKDGKEVVSGPKVAPKSSPLAQLCKIWESVNNITLTNKSNDELYISPEQKQKIVAYMNDNEKLNVTALYKILHISRKDGWWGGKAIGKGLQGNTTRIRIKKALAPLSKDEQEHWLTFTHIDAEIADTETGEIRKITDQKAFKEPFYLLWHMVYSIKDRDELEAALRKAGITNETAIDNLCNLDQTLDGYSNRSAKAMRRILPYLQEGYKYSEACEQAGYRHSDYLTKEENLQRTLQPSLPQIQKNALRQPVVEKILNQLVNIVNAVMEQERLASNRPHPIDEIRIELARELKQNKEERNKAFQSNSKNERENASIAKRIKEDYALIPTRNRIRKYRMWEESNHCCMYCMQPVNVKAFLEGADSEKEHVIPRALLFDDSFSNTVCACRTCNQQKGKQTAYDFMRRTRSKTELENYVTRINELSDKKQISGTKRKHLLASYEDYLTRKSMGKVTEEDKALWESFIDRQLRQSQYIATQAVEMLKTVCRNVYTTSGSITDTVRHLWGYDLILHDLNLVRFRAIGATERVTKETENNVQEVERIINWTKRIDNRHHAIDALTIASTSQGMIQRLNTLNANRPEMEKEVSEKQIKWNEKRNLTENWLMMQPHLDTAKVTEAVEGIIVSQKAGKKDITTSKRYIRKGGKRVLVQKDIIVPRAPLHEEFVYGSIQQNGQTVFVRKYGIIGGMGCLFNGKEEYKEKNGKITDQFKTALDSIVDKGIAKRILQRLNRGFEEGKCYKDDPKRALENLKNLEEDPIYSDDAKTMPIRSVRATVNSSTMFPVRYNKEGKPISFVKPGSNHHVAIYRNEEGEYIEKLVNMWQAVERRRYHFPSIIYHPAQLWDEIVNGKEAPEQILEALPAPRWEFVLSLQIGDTVILGLTDEEFKNALAENNKKMLAEHMYIVQRLSSKNYHFRRHVEAQYDINDMNKPDKRFLNIQSLKPLFDLNPHKVKVDILGNIICL